MLGGAKSHKEQFLPNIGNRIMHFPNIQSQNSFLKKDKYINNRNLLILHYTYHTMSSFKNVQ